MSYVIEYFKLITKYPRPSKHESKIRDFLVDFFSNKGFKYIIDNIGNLIVYIPAKNSSSKEVLILQSHLDMVCVKTDNSKHDFFNDPIEIIEKNGYISANNTSLGADNGIGIALCMSTINFQKHPALELVFTIDEEDGMSGVMGLNYNLLKGNKIINLDSEEENMICISSAGGVGINSKIKINYISGQFPKYNVSIYGMKGGHSGIEIDKNRGNAIMLFLEFLSNYNEDIEIYNINSGTASNVIPSKIKGTLGIANLNIFKENFEKHIQQYKKEFDCPELTFDIIEDKNNDLCIKNGLTILKTLSKIQNGIYSMSSKIDGLVKTSINFGIIKIENGYLYNIHLLRSSDNIELSKIKNGINKYLGENNFEVTFDRGYLGWEDDPNSNLLNIAKSEFKNVLQIEPQIIAIHAGLECGMLVSGLNKDKVNAISIGPNIYNVHSTEEKVEINSVEKMEKILSGILEKISS